MFLRKEICSLKQLTWENGEEEVERKGKEFTPIKASDLALPGNLVLKKLLQ